MEQLDDQSGQIELESFPACISCEVDSPLPVHHILNIHQLLSMIAGHFRGNRIQLVSAEYDNEDQGEEDEYRPPGQVDLPAAGLDLQVEIPATRFDGIEVEESKQEAKQTRDP